MKEINKALTTTIALSSFFYSCNNSTCVNNITDKQSRPNIIVVLADDMGYSDIGCYGGEIQTPNLDRLAKNGVRYAQFYNAARCCPTRASLMTGVYPHQAGMGWMTNADLGTPGYQGDLSNQVSTIAEVLKTAGYGTYMTGKWHLTNGRKVRGNVIDSWPVQRGFDRFFGIIGGAGNYFKLPVYSNNRKYLSPDDFYFTNAISDSSEMFIDYHFKMHPENPFFMYVAYTAPHWPLHALKKDIDKYRGMYMEGWDAIREKRLQKQYKTGLWKEQMELTPRDENVPEWPSLTQDKKEEFALRMAIYAAQVDAMDQGIGQIIEKLEALDQLDNTLIFFLSDNGGCAEYISSGKSKDLADDLESTWESYRIHWANVSNTPFREFKHWIHEGGIRTPLVVHWPEGIDKKLNNSIIREYGHLTDIMATCIDVSGAESPNQIIPVQGASLVPHFSNMKNGRGPIYWEHEANIGMRDGKWKLVAKTPEDHELDIQTLELYNMDDDHTELNDLAEDLPEKVDSMYQAWYKWAQNAQVFPLDTRKYQKRANLYKLVINGEFDMDFGDWEFYNPNKTVKFKIDRSGKISGVNSALITSEKREQEPGDAAIQWVFPDGGIQKFKVSFKTIASQESRLKVWIGQKGNLENKIAQHTYQIGKKENEYVFTTETIKHKGQYQLGFYLENYQAGDSIWLDNIYLLPAD